MLFSNVVGYVYSFLAETNIFRFGVSLICLLYVKEEWVGKKSIIHKDIIYYLKYREFSGMFTINDQF